MCRESSHVLNQNLKFHRAFPDTRLLEGPFYNIFKFQKMIQTKKTFAWFAQDYSVASFCYFHYSTSAAQMLSLIKLNLVRYKCPVSPQNLLKQIKRNGQ
jgi:hypothetical protein